MMNGWMHGMGWWMRMADIAEVKIPVSLELLYCKNHHTIGVAWGGGWKVESGKWVGKGRVAQ